MSVPPVELAGLQTETRNPRTTSIDRVSTQELCQILHREDSSVPAAVEPCLPVIAAAVDCLSERVRRGGRVFYIGAGTSGRLGVLDASEIPPTYSAPPNQFIALIAGGDYALRNAKEGAEDERSGAKVDLDAFNIDPEVDSLIGIASSGRTPYVLGGLAYARSIGCATVGVVCVEPSAIGVEGNADFLINPVTGPESVTGSTRMKAGTVTKLVLNMISTGIMIKLGKTYGNLMIDLKATNLKLKQRARNILRIIGGDLCTQTNEELDRILESCNGSTKLAAVTIVLEVNVQEAEQRLSRSNGVLAQVFAEAAEKDVQQPDRERGIVLCVDAGGTSCKATVMSRDGAAGTGASGPCNISNIGLDSALAIMSDAIQQAVDSCDASKGRRFQSIAFSSAWVGIAGYDRPNLTPLINNGLSQLLNLEMGKGLRVTTDIDLLPVSAASQKDLDSAIVLVAGTGSVSMSYKKSGAQFVRTSRAGGWGYLLGDDGSGYGIARQALRSALRASDLCRMRKDAKMPSEPLPPLADVILQHFQKQFPEAKAEDLLSTVLVPDAVLHQNEDATSSKTRRIAGVAKAVLAMAESDQEASSIVEAGAAALAELVNMLASTQSIVPSQSGLILSGGLMQDSKYRSRVMGAIQKSIGEFKHVEVVDQPATEGARFLLETPW